MIKKFVDIITQLDLKESVTRELELRSSMLTIFFSSLYRGGKLLERPVCYLAKVVTNEGPSYGIQIVEPVESLSYDDPINQTFLLEYDLENCNEDELDNIYRLCAMSRTFAAIDSESNVFPLSDTGRNILLSLKRNKLAEVGMSGVYNAYALQKVCDEL